MFIGEPFKNESCTLKEAGLVNSSLVVIELGKVETQKETIRIKVTWKESGTEKTKEIHSETINFAKDLKVSIVKETIIEKFNLDVKNVSNFRLRLADTWQEADKVICDEHFTLEKFGLRD
jgi:hypothetical protein